MDGPSWKRHLRQWMRKLRVDVEYGSDYARARGVEAVTLPSIDHPAIKICFRDETPRASAILEELAHAAQERRRHFAEADAEEQNALREIEAKQCLDRLADRLQIPDVERDVTRVQLARERARLARLTRWRR